MATSISHPGRIRLWNLIMPLANRRDKATQVVWAIRDFERRFGRFPEGMWLPETAVDLETLDILAEQGIRFTILSQHQAGRVRRAGDSAWQDVGGGQVDPSMVYERDSSATSSPSRSVSAGCMNSCSPAAGILRFV